MKAKGFTLVELLVVIAIIALLMGILMPALSRVRQIAYRMVCGTNLAGIGKAMMIYAGDYEEQYPKAGWRNTTWGKTLNYGPMPISTRDLAFGLSTAATTSATVSSSLYLLVKFAEVTPKAFVCKGASGVTEFKENTLEITQYWDFGKEPWKGCSYSYHMPYNIGTTPNPYALNASSDPSLPVAADFGPWISSPAAEKTTTEITAAFNTYAPDGSADSQKAGNSAAHQGDGQNVMYMDTHVEFESRPTRGVEDDNIYTIWSLPTYTTANIVQVIKKGMLPVPVTVQMPKNRNDSELAHDSTATVGGR